MPISPRKEVDGLSPATHGGPDYPELQSLNLKPGEILDFSVCSNPFGPPASVRRGLRRLASADIRRYPDTEATELRAALAQRLDVGPQSILIGNGSTELIRLAALAYFGPGDAVVVPTPNFGEYEVASCLSGARLITPALEPDDCFRLPVADIADIIRRRHPKGVFLCNPHNPTGQYFSREELEVILDASGDCLVIVDEAYVSFVDGAWRSEDFIARGNLLVLRSMTKDYSLAGLRLGYAVAKAEIIDTLRRVRPPWNVNAVAQAAGLLALQEGDFLKKSMARIQKERDYLLGRIKGMGLPTVPTRANFFLVNVGDARPFRDRLLRRKILVRDCTSFGLPEYTRLSPRRHTENVRLVSALTELVDDGLR